MIAARPDSGIPEARDGPSLLWLERDGKEEIPLRFADVAGRRYVLVTSPDARWRDSVVTSHGWWVREEGGGRWPAVGRLVREEREARAARATLRRKYGERLWDEHFARPGEVLRLERRLEPADRPPRERLRDEFDAVAPVYSARVRSNPLERRLKERTATELGRALAEEDPLLEVGPGIGFETVPLLRAGHSIVAVDVSSRMLQELEARARTEGVSDRLVPRIGSLGELASTLADFPPGYFAAAFSTFGAFNLEPDLREVPAALAAAVRPGGKLIFTSLNRAAGASIAWELLAGRPRRAIERCRPLRGAAGLVADLEVHYRAPSFWDAALAPGFVRTGAQPVSLLTPPFAAPRLLRLLGPTGRRMARRWDEALSRTELFAPLAEWVLLTYRRVDARAPRGRGRQ